MSGGRIYHDYDSDSNDRTPLIGAQQGLVITSTLQGRFVYWKGMKPSKLLDNNESRLVAYLEELPFQDGRPLSDIKEEEDTELVASSIGNYTSEREVSMASAAED
jgi:hypothetical protein